MEQTQIDWSTAEVHEGTLTVTLDGKPSKKWIARFKTTVNLLNHDRWQNVKLKKSEISVSSIAAGDEDRLRHFLESATLETNDALAPDEPDTEPDDKVEDDEDAEPEEDGPDTEMTERFRAFATNDSESSPDRDG